MYYYNDYGWLTSQPNPERSTIELPPVETDTHKANWTGLTWVLVEYTAPPAAAPEPVPQNTKITKLAFRNRFTMTEKVTLEIASLDNPAATMPARQQAAALRANLADTAAATFIDLSRPDTRAGVQMLEAAGLLGVGRALQILDAPVTDSERAA